MPGSAKCLDFSRGTDSMLRTIHALLVAIDDYSSPDPEASGLRPATSTPSPPISPRRGDRQRRRSQPQDPEERRGRLARRSSTPFATTWVGRRKETSPQRPWRTWAGPRGVLEVEPDHLDETLVLFDSRNQGLGPGRQGAGQKSLIGEVAAKGRTSRSSPTAALRLGHARGSTKKRPSSGARPTDVAARSSRSSSLRPKPRSHRPTGVRCRRSDWYAAPEGRHGCSRPAATTRKRGSRGWQASGGLLVLLDAAPGARGRPDVPRPLHPRVGPGFRRRSRNQSPQLEAAQIEDLDASFLDGTIQPMPATFAASYRDGRWAINGGATSGIVAPAGSDAPHSPCTRSMPPPPISTISPRPAMVEVDEVLSASSRLAIDRKVKLDAKTTYKAVLVSLPTPPLSFIVEGSPQPAAVRDAFEDGLAR